MILRSNERKDNLAIRRLGLAVANNTPTLSIFFFLIYNLQCQLNFLLRLKIRKKKMEGARVLLVVATPGRLMARLSFFCLSGQSLKETAKHHSNTRHIKLF